MTTRVVVLAALRSVDAAERMCAGRWSMVGLCLADDAAEAVRRRTVPTIDPGAGALAAPAPASQERRTGRRGDGRARRRSACRAIRPTVDRSKSISGWESMKAAAGIDDE